MEMTNRQQEIRRKIQVRCNPIHQGNFLTTGDVRANILSYVTFVVDEVIELIARTMKIGAKHNWSFRFPNFD